MATAAGTLATEVGTLATTVDVYTDATAEETEVESTTGTEEKHSVLAEKGLQAENRKRYL